MRQIIAHQWIPLVTMLSCLLVPGILRAADGGKQEDAPGGGRSRPTLIVYLVREQVPETAAEFAARLTSPGTANEPLRASVGYPTAARAAVRVPPLPHSLQATASSPRARLARYLTLEYPSEVDVDQMIAQLREDDRFGYVGNARGVAWSATIPNDEYYTHYVGGDESRQREYYLQLNMENVWDTTKGHAMIGVADTGIEVGHEDLLENLRLHHSWDFSGNGADPTELGTHRGHGTHVSGIIAVDTDNDVGAAGSCWQCSLFMSRAGMTQNFTTERIDAFLWMAGNGAQIVNLSGFESPGYPNADFPPGIPCASTPLPDQHPFCSLLEILEDRDIVFTVSSGNDRRRINFPANEPKTIAVGGTERSGELWDDFGVYVPDGCKLPPPHPSWGDYFQCGSNFGPEQDFVAPAKKVLSTFFTGYAHNGPAGCSDDPSDPNTYDPYGSFFALGYDWCTGTSMSAPFVAGVFGLLRSVNPLLSIADAKQAIIDTTGQTGHDDYFGYGIPNAAAAVEHVLGTVGGQQVRNRMTPMFSLFSPVATNYLYTAKPQVASGAVAGTLHELPTSTTVIPYVSASVGSPIAGYPAFPLDSDLQPGPTPVSAFWLFGTDLNPFESEKLVPLYRLSFVEDCDPRDHAYTTVQAGIDYFTSGDWCPDQPGDQVFRFDGIEGYIFPDCPAGFTCADPWDPTQPQCVYRCSSQVDYGHALVLQRELGSAPYETYSCASCIGYVFPNDDSDGDGLIDGFELVLGTDPTSVHSDCDAVTDGEEYPPIGVPVSDPLDPPLDACGCTPPPVGDWVVTESCTFEGTATAPANVIVTDGATLTIASDAILDIQSAEYQLLVQPGGRLSVQPEGRID